VGTCDYFCLPGVPAEMMRMYSEGVEPLLQERSPRRTRVTSLQTFGLPESVVGERLQDLMSVGNKVQVATQARGGVIAVRISATGDDPAAAQEQVERVEREVRDRLGEAVFGEEKATLQEAVAAGLEARGLTLAVGESCTGGEIAARLTDVPGISRFFVEGAVTYSNAAKVRRLRVPPALLEQHGAVSAPVAQAMARGIREVSGAALGLAVTGIAGPGGGTPAKPVGLVYLALSDARDTDTCDLHLAGGRQQIRDRITKHALNMLRLYLER
jgi:nicotinamide-nucleotide amidase